MVSLSWAVCRVAAVFAGCHARRRDVGGGGDEGNNGERERGESVFKTLRPHYKGRKRKRLTSVFQTQRNAWLRAVSSIGDERRLDAKKQPVSLATRCNVRALGWRWGGIVFPGWNGTKARQIKVACVQHFLFLRGLRLFVHPKVIHLMYNSSG